MNWVLALLTGWAVAAGPVTELSITPDAQRTTVVIAIDGPVEFRDFTMEGPNRLVVDVMGARHALPRDNFPGIDRGGIRGVRTSQYSPDIVRVVIELDELVGYLVQRTARGIEVSLENPAGAFQPWSASGAPAAVSAAAMPAAPAVAPPPMRTVFPIAPPAAPRAQEVPRMTVTFDNTPIQDVLFTFAEFADRSIVAGTTVRGTVTAEIRDQPWDVALQAVLQAQGLRAEEDQFGIIRVDDAQQVSQRETVEPLRTQSYRINFGTALELQTAITSLLTPERGQVSVSTGTNAVIVTDLERVQRQVADLIQQLDVRTPQVMIEAKILLVNRTDLNEFGIVYDLKDSEGNQINAVTPGAVDSDGDGVVELPSEQVAVGTNVISLGGTSIAALGNATNRVAGPSLTLLTSLLIGRHTLLSFIEALQSVNMSEIQAVPTVTVVDNSLARIQVGELTPLRVLDAGATGAGGALPVANVSTQNTGIILEATPHVTANETILLDLHAERSAPQIAESDVGFVFTTQNTDTRVLVRDGQTIVIAGLTVTETQQVRSGLPLLMDLPIIGRLFRTTRSSRIQRDLIILVTPHIVRDGTAP